MLHIWCRIRIQHLDGEEVVGVLHQQTIVNGRAQQPWRGHGLYGGPRGLWGKGSRTEMEFKFWVKCVRKRILSFGLNRLEFTVSIIIFSIV